ncbi:MAG: hypothetical protein JAY85_07710 [Candidatus Thiodiazotropha weberae]|uniref:hypothetical protein n=1 Tax=Candidatus Thiodiazotropha endoloripes TaxID=1818881 RepID=UPI00083DDE16|nr:hypothetical protein [Candidatus Thiodiazotropha endoloripes]MCG7898328.1 hypothetical protein [Candidatus Thiodiazotropha weberae]MCG7901079.1 hypothetical protein [Candidatus Thiodiazotropha weberae]MCG7913322.1 hypothetical protein [Candidatus Thiodiazotropha weberae]ODB90328.1 hypothetical protein A3195_02210 [Candidatus Thiodiazotropha endoloripes]
MNDGTERYEKEFFPSNYAGWRYCIEVKCSQALTPEFVKARITILGDSQHEESRRFASLYSHPWREQVLAWFQRAAAEV